MALKKNENKGDVEFTLSPAHYVGIAVIYLSVFRLLLAFCDRVSSISPSFF